MDLLSLLVMILKSCLTLHQLETSSPEMKRLPTFKSYLFSYCNYLFAFLVLYLEQSGKEITEQKLMNTYILSYSIVIKKRGVGQSNSLLGLVLGSYCSQTLFQFH